MLCAALSIIIIDETILYVALPVMFRELEASNAQMQWAVDAYVVIYAALLLPAGNLGDRYGRRTFLLIGLVVFGVGSLGAAWAPAPMELVVARSVMAVGGGLIMPQTLSILSEVFPEDQRGFAIGVWSGVAGIGIVAGPLVGGVLVEHFWWGSIFLVNVPVIVVALVSSVLLLPNHRDKCAAPADGKGAALGVFALLALLCAIIEAPGRGLGDPVVYGSALIGVCAAIAFVQVERSQTQPMLDLAVLRMPRVVVCGVVILVTFGALQGTSYGFTQYLQFVQGRSALQAGLIFAPTTIGWSVTSPLSPRLVRRFGMRSILVVTLLVNALCYALYAVFAANAPLWLLLTLCGVQGVAMGICITPVTDLLMGALPQARAGVASALNDVARQVGGAVGVAVLGAILAGVLSAHLGSSASERFGDLFTAGHDTSDAKDALVAGYRWVMSLGALTILAAVPIVWRSSGIGSRAGNVGRDARTS